jgi:ketosteroid isomerase-like protein
MAASKPTVAHLATPDEMERQFYDALQHGDIDRLMAVWADDDEITCVHPGGPRLVGAAAIRASFSQMFSQGVVQAEPGRVRRLHTHSTAMHSVIEQVQVMSAEGPRSAWVVATNVYVKTGLGWRMVLHHASPGSAAEWQEAAEPSAVLH